LEIIPFTALRRSEEVQVFNLHLQGWSSLADFRHLLRMRRLGYPFAKYMGVFARQHGELLSQVFVGHYRFQTPDGPVRAAGIEELVTRSDARRRGLAHRLFEEVHRRERKDHVPLALLWTGKSNMAHELYVKLGYRDIYEPHRVLRFVTRPARSPARGLRVRSAVSGDADLLDRLHRQANRGRLGFAQRAPHSFRTRFRLGIIEPTAIVLAEREGHPVGYATLFVQPGWAWSHEVGLLDPSDRPAFLAKIEARIAPRWLQLGADWLIETDEFRLPSGYYRGGSSYAVLMACPLTPRLRRPDLARWLNPSPAAFACQHLDRF
jgi:GNAT superfamily N-acetyltransferase